MSVHSPTEIAPRSTYLAHLLQQRSLRLNAPAWLNDQRDRAAARLPELAIPSTRDEAWRFTDLADLLQLELTAAAPASLSFEAIQPFVLPEAASSRLVFVNGYYDPALSAIDDLPDGLFAGSLLAAAELLKPLSDRWAHQPGAEEVFTALNTASLSDGAVVWVPRHQVVEPPIQILFVSTATQPTIAHPRCVVVAETGSQLTLIEQFVALHEGAYCTNAVTEVWVEGNAAVNHTRVQQESTRAFHIGKTSVTQARDSRYTGTAIGLGAHLSRHNLEVCSQGEQTHTRLNGLTLLSGEQTGDTHSTIGFNRPHSRSEQVHKCIVADRAHAVFNGKIWVPKPAQLTDAAQLSRTLLLSPKARIDTQPQLEITADNVKCAHGATVSQLEADELFYLQSRGINTDSARQLLVYAFAAEVINGTPLLSLREQLARQVRSMTQ